ncbi:MAG: hypothetical protein H7232_13450 [Aeromicrobium sp.]|nr:hypothetical protein [Burkholderiales bacterium]
MEAVVHITGSEKVSDALGFWPTFHDAEVISFSAERALPLQIDYTVARLAVHVRHYKSVGEGTVDYELALQKSVLVRFVFHGACDFTLSEFNHQNVINSISVSCIDNNEAANLRVDIESIWGFGGSLRCSSVAIEAVELLFDARA